MICYYYPPLTDVGCKRSVAFSKYFAEHGWKPHILTVRNADKTYCSLGNDPIPPGIPVARSLSIFNIYWLARKLNGLITKLLGLFGIRLSSNYVSEFLCTPDPFWGWIPSTLFKALGLIKKSNCDLIYVSCSPFSAAIVGVLLKMISGKPLVLDFRDPFALKGSMYQRGSKIRQITNSFLENKFLRYADLVIFTTEETKNLYRLQYPIYEDKLHTVHNGFDGLHKQSVNPEKYAKFTIVCGGNLYMFATMQSTVFFESMADLKNRHAINKSNFRFIYCGSDKERVAHIANDLNIEDIVLTKGTVPYHEMIETASRSHLYFLTILPPMISTKLYEGIALNVPFLALIPHGEVEAIIKEYSPSSYIVSDGSKEAITESILAAKSSYENGKVVDNRIEDFLHAFSRERLTLKLMQIIEDKLG